MPNRPRTRRERPIPGLSSHAIFDQLDFNAEGGSFDGRSVRIFPVYRSHLVESDTPTVALCVRRNDLAFKSLDVINDWISDEKSYDESEAYAKRLAREWHLEFYQFSHWLRPATRLRGGRGALYRFSGAANLSAQAASHRWHLCQGSQITLPAANHGPRGSSDRFDVACRGVEEACEAFGRIAALLPAGPLAEKMAGPVAAVESSRSEARRLAALGQHLDSVPDPNDEVMAREKLVLAQIEALRQSVLAAVALITDVGLALPDGGAENVRSFGTTELAALAAALIDVKEIAGGPRHLEPAAKAADAGTDGR